VKYTNVAADGFHQVSSLVHDCLTNVDFVLNVRERLKGQAALLSTSTGVDYSKTCTKSSGIDITKPFSYVETSLTYCSPALLLARAECES